MVEEWVYKQPDFAAQLNPIPQPKTGISLLRQGMKHDFMYQADKSCAWMIHYALLDAQRNLLPEEPLCEGEVKAYFRVVNPELRLKHKQRIKPGIEFYVVAGSYKIAKGVVTEVLHLVDEN
ncbi:MAG: hypothetical protein KI793_32690 [Rivularia sp. (in: Bacteria)]|nr:hypothetical protein [Rivularia sp. MS3]